MTYVDGILIAVPAASREALVKHARELGTMFTEAGALRVVDTWGDDVPKGKLTDMYMAVQAKDDEVVCFSWVEWASKEVRDASWGRLMSDPRMQSGAITPPYDGKRMIYGGFAMLNDARAPAPAGDWELSVTRYIDAPRAKLWRCWTEPALLKQWFCPRPWFVSRADMDVRAGGYSRITMNGPNGESHENEGVYLEVLPQQKLVFTDAYTSGWKPSAKPFMTGIAEFADEGGGTRYTARARHWTRTDMETHEAMGFTPGWNAATDQLVELAKTL